MALPGYPIKVYAKASNAAPGAGDEIDGINDASYEEMIDLFEITDFKSGSASAWKLRLGGLNDASIDLSGDFEAADAPQILMRTSKRTGTTVWISIYFNPSAGAGVFKGYQLPVLVENFKVGDTVGGKTELSYSLKANGAVTEITG